MSSGEYLLTYTRKRIADYARSLLELSRCYYGSGENLLSIREEEDLGDEDRRETIDLETRLENSRMLGDYLRDISATMERLLKESGKTVEPSQMEAYRVRTGLKREGILVKSFSYIEKEKQKEPQILMVLSSRKKEGQSKKEIADYLSVLLHKRLTASVETPDRIGGEPEIAVFIPESRYFVIQGIARAIKDGETVSGDGFSIMERESGEVTAILSDGMGCGPRASKDSSEVLDYMERLMETGFEPDRAMESVNRLLTCNGKENMSTLDVCNIDLVRGIGRFYKVGGTCSLLKSGNYVEKITSPGLPLGLWNYEEEHGGMGIPVMQRELVDGDYIVMMTDGVIDALQNCGYEEALLPYVENMRALHPREMAEYLLQYVLHLCGGQVEDDMTVLVLGIFDVKH